MGTREVTLIGGEAYLRRDWLQIIREIRDQGMDCTMQSGGLNLTEDRIKAAVDAGLQALGISIDGLREVHDRVRGVQGSFDAAFNALDAIQKCGIASSVNTQITSLVIPQLRELMNLFIEAGAKSWQLQLTVAMGRAADNPELLLQPYKLLELMPLLAELFEEGADRGFLSSPETISVTLALMSRCGAAAVTIECTGRVVTPGRTRSGSKLTARSRDVHRCRQLLMRAATFATSI